VNIVPPDSTGSPTEIVVAVVLDPEPEPSDPSELADEPDTPEDDPLLPAAASSWLI
jgi:hypothetical protein